MSAMMPMAAPKKTQSGQKGVERAGSPFKRYYPPTKQVRLIPGERPPHAGRCDKGIHGIAGEGLEVNLMSPAFLVNETGPIAIKGVEKRRPGME
jgi:hypothetical protein